MACCSPSCFPMTAKAKSPSPPFSGAVPVSSVSCTNYYSSRSTSRASRLIQSSLHSTYYYSYSTPSLHETLVRRPRFSTRPSSFLVMSSGNKLEPLKVMISGAPASGKGTQCQLITQKMVKERLSQSDSQENGWLLDGYPRSLSQATALKESGFQPDIFILLEVAEENLVERVVGRRLDPVTGRIYHLQYSPPETEEIAARLTQRFDDTEEKVKLRLQTHHQNVESVLSMYEGIIVKVNGNASKEDVFSQIDNALTNLIGQKNATLGGSMAA